MDSHREHEHESYEPFHDRGTKMPYKLKQTCIFQLLDCLSVYNFLLPFTMKLLKAKTVHEINGLIRDIQYLFFFVLLLTRHAIWFLCLKPFTPRVTQA